MAAGMEGLDEPPLASKAKFSISGEDLDKMAPPETTGKESQKDGKLKSRFKVNKVEFAGCAGPGHVDGPAVVCLKRNSGVPRADDIRRKRQDSTMSTTSRTSSTGDRNSDFSPPISPLMNDTYIGTYGDQKTFGRNTLETLPHIDHYRNLLSAAGAMRKRPTLLELREQEDGDLLLEEAENGHALTSPKEIVEEVNPVVTAPKFGWIQGVLVRCLLNIWGVMLFLRLSWVVGQAGIGLAIVIILLAGVVTTITALSMSAICTNGEVKGGGAYYMISRSLGPEFGGAIGLIFSVANAVAVAMYVVGFAETIRDLLKQYDLLMVDEINDVRIIGVITVFVLLGIALIGMEWEARAQLVLLAILLVAIVNFVIGTFLPITHIKEAHGITGYKRETFVDNIGPDFREGESFFSVFAIFFPAATGILAGANISGDLQDAQVAIPKGTLWAILISTITYVLMAWMAGSCVARDAAGLVPAGVAMVMVADENGTMIAVAQELNDTLLAPGVNLTAAGMENQTRAATCTPGSCSYGLQNDMQVMQLVSGFGPLVIAGIVSATLSSALASLVSAPKVFQAVCKDRIFPKIHVFAKGYGKAEEPRRAYLLAFAIGLAFICIGELNAIAPLISNFFLMSYALINYSCFDASLAKSPGWRPAFRFYSMWLSLVGAMLCLGVMFVINWWTALITFVIVAALYIYVHYRKPDINWGSSTQAHVYRNALQSTLKLVTVMEHVKNFRPQILVLTGFPPYRQALVDFANNITKNTSLMICAHIIKTEEREIKELRTKKKKASTWLYRRRIKAFYSVLYSPSFRLGAQSLLQTAGVGKLKPNTLFLGFKNNWQTMPPGETEEYFGVIHDAFDLHYGVGILRLKEGLDFSHVVEELPDEVSPEEEPPEGPSAAPGDIELLPREPSADSLDKRLDEDDGRRAGEGIVKGTSRQINKDLLQSLNIFQRKQKKGTIDVWWLFDDGGLTLLVPFILSNKKLWQNCKLRVFTAGTKKGDLDRDQRHMATLLSKFRIDYSDMTVLPDVGKRPNDESKREFMALIKDWMLNERKGETKETHPWKISEHELTSQKEKTYRQIRIRELMLKHSKDATLIVATFPVPKKGLCPSGLYMAWLETLTRDMPPILLLRGNQESVLTYYS